LRLKNFCHWEIWYFSKHIMNHHRSKFQKIPFDKKFFTASSSSGCQKSPQIFIHDTVLYIFEHKIVWKFHFWKKCWKKNLKIKSEKYIKSWCWMFFWSEKILQCVDYRVRFLLYLTYPNFQLENVENLTTNFENLSANF